MLSGKGNCLMKKFVTMILCLLLLVMLPADAHAATNSVTTRNYNSNFADKKIPKLKTGKNKITIKNNVSSGILYRGVKYVAPKNGTYTFKFTNLRSSAIDYPMCTVTAHCASSIKSKSDHYQVVQLSLASGEYRSFNLISPDWASEIGDATTIASLNNLNYMDYSTLTLTLKKGMVVVLSMSSPQEIIDGHCNCKATNETMAVDVKITRN